MTDPVLESDLLAQEVFRSPSEIIHDLVKTKLLIAEQNAILKALEKQYDGFAEQAKNSLENLKLKSVTNGNATLSISDKTVGTVKDWDALYGHILENGAFELLERRVSQKAWGELNTEDSPIPGTEPYTMTQVKLTIKR